MSSAITKLFGYLGRAHPFRSRKLLRTIALGLLAVVLAACVPFARWLVNDWGRGFVTLGIGIFETDPTSDYLVGWLYAIIILGSILFWPVKNAHRGMLIKFWLLRCLITLVAMLAYEGFYALDAYGYFHEARYPEFRWPVTFGDNWAMMSYFTWWVNHTFLIQDSYHALKVIFSLFGMLGSYLLYLGILANTRREDTRLMVLLQVIPSMLFWSSILGKDPLNFFAICLYCYGVLAWLGGKGKLGSWAAVAMGLLIAFLVRQWTAYILTAPLFALVLNRVPVKIIRYVGYACIPFLLMKAGEAMMQKVGLNSMSEVVTATREVSRSWARGGSALEAPNFQSVGDIIKFAPLGMFTALFRPLPGEIMNPFGLLAGFENLTLLGFVVMGIRRKWQRWEETPNGERTLILWCVITILCWSLVYGFISYQNLGAAFRFRLQILPLLVMLVIFLNRKSESLRFSQKKAELLAEGQSEDQADEVADEEISKEDAAIPIGPGPAL